MVEAWIPFLVLGLFCTTLALRSMVTAAATHPQLRFWAIAYVVDFFTAESDPDDSDNSSFSWWWLALVIVVVAGLLTGIVYLLLNPVFRTPQILQWATFAFSIGLYLYSLVRLYPQRKYGLLACAGAALAIASWFMWPNLVTYNVAMFAVALCFVAVLLQLNISFKFAAATLIGMCVYDVLNVYITGAVIALKEQSASATLPTSFRMPKEFTMHPAEVVGIGGGDLIWPAWVLIVVGIIAYRAQAMWVWYAGLAGFTVGLLVALTITRLVSPQPALLYITPGLLGAVLLSAWRAGIIGLLFGRAPGVYRG